MKTRLLLAAICLVTTLAPSLVFAQASDPKDPDVPAPSKLLISGEKPKVEEPTLAPVDAPEVLVAPVDLPPAPPEKPKPEVIWTLNAGGNLNTGNTRSWTVVSGTHFNLKLDPHEFDAAYAFNYGRADADGALHAAPGYQTNTKNSLLQLRYNHWFTESDALYVGYIHRWDRFAGLQSRNRFDVGYIRKLWYTESQSLNTEVGFAYIFDRRVSGITPRDQHNASGRVFLGYTNQINEGAKFATGIEVLENFNRLNETPSDIDPFQDLRVNWDATLTAQLWSKLALEAKFRLEYDRKPAAVGLANVDTKSMLSLIYTLM